VSGPGQAGVALAVAARLAVLEAERLTPVPRATHTAAVDVDDLALVAAYAAGVAWQRLDSDRHMSGWPRDLDAVTATRATRSVLRLAGDGGLNPHLGAEGTAPDRHGRVRVLIRCDDGRHDALYGVIYLSARTGRILASFLTYFYGPQDREGCERRYGGTAATRTALSSWIAATRGPRP
jgi:hypothetical protein